MKETRSGSRKGAAHEINGRIYREVDMVHHPTIGSMPLLDVRMMSDERWRELTGKQ